VHGTAMRIEVMLGAGSDTFGWIAFVLAFSFGSILIQNVLNLDAAVVGETIRLS